MGSGCTGVSRDNDVVVHAVDVVWVFSAARLVVIIVFENIRQLLLVELDGLATITGSTSDIINDACAQRGRDAPELPERATRRSVHILVVAAVFAAVVRHYCAELE